MLVHLKKKGSNEKERRCVGSAAAATSFCRGGGATVASFKQNAVFLYTNPMMILIDKFVVEGHLSSSLISFK